MTIILMFVYAIAIFFLLKIFLTIVDGAMDDFKKSDSQGNTILFTVLIVCIMILMFG